mmetsp:Transcript_32914/g.49686  ORF Transcript_32914/g.49686 Transcript_32914/m.49686 type:complete len:383 (-) Transcript_32914:160-1308(-)
MRGSMAYMLIGIGAILIGTIRENLQSPSFLDFPSAKRSVMDVMTALTYEKHGGIDVLKTRGDFPRPIPRDNQVLLQIKASSINPVDFKNRRNEAPDFVIPKPKIPGYDIAGIVVEIGDKVSDFQVGDRVVGMMPLVGSCWGAAAEFAAIRESNLCKIGKNNSIDFETAAAVPLAALTAVQKLDKIPNPSGKKILIQAGAGGVGTFAIQYAKHVLGMFVAATASAPKAEFLKNLGADIVVDYKSQDFSSEIKSYDAVLDTMSFEYERRTLNEDSNVLKASGIYLNVISSDWALHDGKEKAIGSLSFLNFLKHKIVNFFISGVLPRYDIDFVRPDGKILSAIIQHIAEGEIKPVIDSIYNLEDAVDAYKKLETGRVTGKIVLRH